MVTQLELVKEPQLGGGATQGSTDWNAAERSNLPNNKQHWISSKTPAPKGLKHQTKLSNIINISAKCRY